MAEQTKKQEIAFLWQASRLTLTGEYVTAPEILRVHGSAIGTLGNFSASIGKAKVSAQCSTRLGSLTFL